MAKGVSPIAAFSSAMSYRDPVSRFHLAEAGALIAEPPRAAMMIALLDGSARPATELCQLSGVATGTASTHLRKLCEGKLLTVSKQGRFRFYRLANEDVAHLVEALSLIRQPRGGSLPQLMNDSAMSRARTCYGHLAGRLGVRIFSRLAYIEGLEISEASVRLTPVGMAFLIDHGIASRQDDVEQIVGGACLDATERCFHLSGELGRYILERLKELGWVRSGRESHALHICPSGLKGFAEIGVNLAEIS